MIFNNEFKVNWLFDFEIFIKLHETNYLSEGIEFPLLKWKDIGGSKISWKDSFKIFKEIIILFYSYNEIKYL